MATAIFITSGITSIRTWTKLTGAAAFLGKLLVGAIRWFEIILVSGSIVVALQIFVLMGFNLLFLGVIVLILEFGGRSWLVLLLQAVISLLISLIVRNTVKGLHFFFNHLK